MLAVMTRKELDNLATRLVSVSEAADLLGVSRQRVQILVQQERLPAVAIGGTQRAQWLIYREAIEATLRGEPVGKLPRSLANLPGKLLTPAQAAAEIGVSRQLVNLYLGRMRTIQFGTGARPPIFIDRQSFEHWARNRNPRGPRPGFKRRKR